MKTLNLKLYFLTVLLASFFLRASGQDTDAMYAHFIDVGQGQAILLEFPKGAVLIDAGGQKDMKEKLLFFLGQFFARRTDLNRTLNGVIITHQHVDHDQDLKDIVGRYKVLNYVDNGHHDPHGSGKMQPWMQQHVGELHINYEAITYDKVTAGHNLKGLTDGTIDPVTGSPVDPLITVYSGAFLPGEVSDMKENNHSLVVKVMYGHASFLFMGDLETSGIEKVTDYYKNTAEVLKADVLQVGHHGAKNAMTKDWVKAVRPKYAIINCGQWNWGVNADSTGQAFTTYAYGHPNKKAIDLLEKNMTDNRPQPINVMIGISGTDPTDPTVKPKFKPAIITKNIFATAWNGNINIKATSDGQYAVVSDR
jgi:beta-lactamase superfamily II metal-dependent hydrolase